MNMKETTKAEDELEMMETTKAEDEPEMKIRREITSPDDDELYAGFEWEETNKILNGEIKPKTLITIRVFVGSKHPERGPLIAREMLSLFPNSSYMSRGIKAIRLAKKKGCTTLVLAYSSVVGHDELCIISLLNGASATFRVHDLVPRIEIPNCGVPPNRRYPHLHMINFKFVCTSRMIQSLFPKVPSSRKRSFVWCEQQNDHIFFRHHRFCSEEEAVAGASSSSARRLTQECGPRFSLKLMSVDQLSFFRLVCSLR